MMAIAHVCTACGEDLALIAPEREPHYGWMLVRCPRCDAPAVRREHAVRALWRRARKRSKAAAGLFGRLGAFAGVSAGVTAWTGVLAAGSAAFAASPDGLGLTTLIVGAFHAAGANRPIFEQWVGDPGNAAQFIGLVVVSGMAGVFLPVLLRHRRWWAVLPAWGLWLLVLVSVVRLLFPAAWLFVEGGSEADVREMTRFMQGWGEHAAWTLVAWLLTVGAWIPGVISRGVTARLIRRRRWAMRRRLRQQRRQA